MAKRDFPVPEKAGKQETSTQAAHDAETVRLVREFAYKMRRAKGFARRLYKSGEFGEYELCAAYGVAKVASKLISILNRPAKKGKKNG